MQYLDTIVGGQYGSEAKGHVTAQLVKAGHMQMDRAGVDGKIINVRVAGPNAGHTAYDAEGRKFAFRSLPIGAIVDNRTLLYIAPGSEVDLDVLYKEIAEAVDAGHPIEGRLYVSRQATLLTDDHKLAEEIDGLVGRIGSTGKGIGAARADRIMRRAQTLEQWFEGNDPKWWTWAEPEDLYATDKIVREQNTHVILEGTQGYGLSLRASGHYPQVTSSDARAVDFWAMAGIDPTRRGVMSRTWVVARVYPIRVAGNSGPMKGETTWEALGLEPEKTTVTQKIRRVGAWDADLVRRAVQANGGEKSVRVVITMLDQVIPELADFEPGEFLDGLPPVLEKVNDWIEEHASFDKVGALVGAITFGPTKILFTDHAEEENPLGQIDERALQSALYEIFGKGE